MSPYFSYKKGYKDGAHDTLCKSASSILESQGYNVEFEKVIPIKNGPQKRYEVDVYGEKDGKIIIYECGDCKQEKIDWLRKNIGIVIHLPYLDKWFSRRWPSWRDGLTKEDMQKIMDPLSNRLW